jgi:hypothetical protein
MDINVEGAAMNGDERVQYLLDREDIRDVVSQYCRAFDRCDQELLADVYWPDGIHEHGKFRGTGQEFAEFAMPKIRKYFMKSHHSINNFYFDVRGNIANVESYVTAFHLISGDADIVRDVFGEPYHERHRSGDADAHDFIFLGRYIDLLEKRDAKWRIKKRIITTEWNLNQPATVIWSGALVSDIPALGTRDKSDLSYQHTG